MGLLQRFRDVLRIGRDLGLFMRSARTDAVLRRLQSTRAAFELVYRDRADPWASADARYGYQSRKYDGILASLPPGRRFASVLDLGCGLGLLSQRLAERADAVLGIDLAQCALDSAAMRTAALTCLTYQQGDITALPETLNGRFDLVTIADTVYYMPRPITDTQLRVVAARIVQLLGPGGMCLLANHYVFAADPDSRLTRRIHRAFKAEHGFAPVSSARHVFYLVDLLAVR